MKLLCIKLHSPASLGVLTIRMLSSAEVRRFAFRGACNLSPNYTIQVVASLHLRGGAQKYSQFCFLLMDSETVNLFIL